MNELLTNYQQVQHRISAATEHSGGRSCPDLLAVSKKHSVDKIKILAAAGQRDFGESYAQEGLDKIKQLSGLPLIWHFIGPIQSNKAKLIAPAFDWVHSVDRLKVLELLNQYRGAIQSPINVLLQLKVGSEQSKSGASDAEIFQLAELAQQLKHIVIRGVMCIPPPSDDVVVQSDYFKQAKIVFDKLKSKYPSVDTLSMGMSGDLEAAIQTGSTLVRIGTDIFGTRNVA
jgi:pyridoxal phosphate enzyme (YggS family)